MTVADEKNSSVLECDDFRWGLLDYGIQITKEEANEIMNYFDSEGKAVKYHDFLKFVESQAPKKEEAEEAKP